jgi:hypothetical protein
VVRHHGNQRHGVVSVHETPPGVLKIKFPVCKGEHSIFSDQIIQAALPPGLKQPEGCDFNKEYYEAFYKEYYQRVFEWFMRETIPYSIIDVRAKGGVGWPELTSRVGRCPCKTTSFPHSNDQGDKHSTNWCKKESTPRATEWHPC